MNRGQRRSALFVSLLASSCVSAVGAASAQEAVILDPVVIEGSGEATGDGAGNGTGPFEGYVPQASTSATKGSAPLIETPQAVSVVGAEQIEDQAARSVTEATRYSPGIRSETFGDDTRNDWFLIRGFSSQVNSYFLDGLQLQSSDSFATWKVNPYLLERIDVLRGPSSALYGSSNPGGLINLESKRPTFQDRGEVSVGVNEFGNVWTGTDVEGVSQDGAWAYRFVGTGNLGDTKVDYIDDDQFAFLPSITYAPSADTSFSAYLHVSRLETQGQNFLPYEGTVDSAPYGRIARSFFASEPDRDVFERDQALIGYEFEHSFNENVTVRQNLRYGKLNVDILGSYGLGYVGVPTAETALLSRGAFRTNPDLDLFNVDNQLEVKAETGPVFHTLLFGLDYKDLDLEDSAAYGSADPLDIINPVYGGAFDIPDPTLTNTQQRQLGFYAQDTLEIGRLNVVLSGRYDDVSADIDNVTAGTSTDTSSNAFSGRAGIIYNFDNGLAPWASVSRSFLPLLGTDDVTGSPFDPEEGTQYEAGLKYQPQAWGGSLIGASVFDLTRENIVTSDGINFNRQIGQVNSRGVELEAVGQITDSLKGIASYTWYDLEIEEGNPIEIGNETTGTPESFASLWLDYTVPSGRLEGLSVGGGMRYVGDSFADAANTLEVPDVFLFDAAIRYEKNNFEAALNASNIFDEKYVASCNSTCFYGEAREVNLTLTYKW